MSLILVSMVVLAAAAAWLHNRCYAKDPTEFAEIVEWRLLLAVASLVFFHFLQNNGFVNSSDIQPYPY